MNSREIDADSRRASSGRGCQAGPQPSPDHDANTWESNCAGSVRCRVYRRVSQRAIVALRSA